MTEWGLAPYKSRAAGIRGAGAAARRGRCGGSRRSATAGHRAGPPPSAPTPPAPSAAPATQRKDFRVLKHEGSKPAFSAAPHKLGSTPSSMPAACAGTSYLLQALQTIAGHLAGCDSNMSAHSCSQVSPKSYLHRLLVSDRTCI